MDTDTPVLTKRKKQNRLVSANPLQLGIVTFLKLHRPEALDSLQITHDIPKRYTIYPPLLLLGPTFVSHTCQWQAFFSSLSGPERKAMFECIVDTFGSREVTHIASNAPILALNPDFEAAEKDEGRPFQENLLRSPINLLPLHGDFGPETLLDHVSITGNGQPQHDDFDAALWVTAVQHKTVVQCWAPRWTMFSRGNISEKARILQEQSVKSPFPGLSPAELGEPLETIEVVDFYIGIGYFAFCYLTRGMKRVWGWELNGWSVEGLRRGCERNGWECLVVRIPDDEQFHDTMIKDLVEAMAAIEKNGRPVRCVAFLGDNKWVSKILTTVDRYLNLCDQKPLNVRHCNLGLLPTSKGSRVAAVKVLNQSKGGWIHAHENAEIAQLDEKKADVMGDFCSIVQSRTDKKRELACEHIEMVKTYAPGIAHYVFDIKVWPTA